MFRITNVYLVFANFLLFLEQRQQNVRNVKHHTWMGKTHNWHCASCPCSHNKNNYLNCNYFNHYSHEKCINGICKYLFIKNDSYYYKIEKCYECHK